MLLMLIMPRSALQNQLLLLLTSSNYFLNFYSGTRHRSNSKMSYDKESPTVADPEKRAASSPVEPNNFSGSDNNDEGVVATAALHRNLKGRHMQMIAM
jgi:amino acid permease